jgi:DNA gyrase subunit A
MVNLLPLQDGERINTILPVRDFAEDRFVFMATSSGTVKKTPLEAFSRPRASGIIAVDLRGDDRLIGVAITDGSSDIMLFSSDGKAIRFSEDAVRPMGRTAAGVIGIRLAEGERVMSLVIADQGDILTVTENGYGKRTPVDQYPLRGRAGQGVISIATSDRNGGQVGAILVQEDDEVMLITDGGTLVRTRVSDVSVLSRNTQGVTMIRLSKKEKLIGIEGVATLAGEGLAEDEAAEEESSDTNDES